jgi:NTE family protein
MELIDTIILEGGGVKAVAYAGVASALQEYNIYENLRTLIGSSAGSIGCTCMAIGYSPEELSDVLNGTDFKKFKDPGGYFGALTELNNLRTTWGIYSTDYLYTWLGNLINSKTNNPDITFSELYTLYHKNLIITATNLSKSNTLFFNYKNTPDVPIRLAVRASSSIFLFYPPVIYNGDYLIDGGTIDNYAITYNEINLSKSIGFRFSNDGLCTIDRSFNTLNEYIDNFIGLLLAKANIENMTPKTWSRTVTIDTLVSATNFNITEEEKKELVDEAYNKTILFLKSNSNFRYNGKHTSMKNWSM